MRAQITAVALGLSLSVIGIGLPATATAEATAIEALQQQVAALLQRVAELERTVAGGTALTERVAAVEATNDRQTDQLAQG